MTLTARVRVGTPPDVPPSDLTEFVAPVVSAVGTLEDWELVPERVFSTDPSADGAIERFLRWHASWERWFDLGPPRLLDGLRRFVAERKATGAPFSNLDRLDLDGDELGVARTAQLADELERARRIVVGATESGWGIVDASPQPDPGLLVGAAPLWGPEELLSGSAINVSCEADEGVVVSGTPPVGRLALQGWELDQSCIRLHPRSGDPVLLDNEASRELARLAPAANAVRIRRAPLSSIWAPPIVSLSAAARLAIQRRSQVAIGTASPFDVPSRRPS